MTKSLRQDAPELWSGIVGWCREIGIDWPEDDIAAVIGKVRATQPDALPDTIGRVLEWCREAERIGGDTDEVATVDLWRTPGLPIEIMVDDAGRLSHRLDVEKQPERQARLRLGREPLGGRLHIRGDPPERQRGAEMTARQIIERRLGHPLPATKDLAPDERRAIKALAIALIKGRGK